MKNLEIYEKFRPEELCIKKLKHWIVCVRQKCIKMFKLMNYNKMLMTSFWQRTINIIKIIVHCPIKSMWTNNIENVINNYNIEGGTTGGLEKNIRIVVESKVK